MPIEPSEIELLLKHYFSPYCDKYRAVVLKALEDLIRPVIANLECRVTEAVQELDDCQNELADEQNYKEELVGEIEELEGDKEWENMVATFWKLCEKH
jgi:hypothetical protein